MWSSITKNTKPYKRKREKKNKYGSDNSKKLKEKKKKKIWPRPADLVRQTLPFLERLFAQTTHKAGSLPKKKKKR